MLHFSEKEYHNLRDNLKEVRSCITTYIGYIISATVISGLPSILGIVFKAKNIHPVYQTMFVISLMFATTFLFEIIWYKFKSHNRIVGYMQLLLLEQDYFLRKDINPKNLSDGNYIVNYKSLIGRSRIQENIFGWESILSYHNQTNTPHSKDVLEKVIKSSSGLRYVFSMPEGKYDYSNIEKYKDLDIQFFKRIILTIYGEVGASEVKEKRKTKILFANFFQYFKYLFFTNSKSIVNNTRLDDKYFVSGWKYPKEITRIAFLSIFSLFCFSLIHMIYFDQLYFSLLSVEVTILIWWYFKYIRNLKDLIYRKYSIDGYSWTFFLYRVRQLNARGIYPIYFSRSFIRYFKSKLILELLQNPEFEMEIIKDLSITYYELVNYKESLSECSKFEDQRELEIHSAVMKIVKNLIY